MIVQTRVSGVTEIKQKPKIEEIIFVSGEIITNARLEIDAPALPGFLAIISKDLKESTQYIALSSIQSLTIKNNEIMRFSPERYIVPEATIKVRRE